MPSIRVKASSPCRWRGRFCAGGCFIAACLKVAKLLTSIASVHREAAPVLARIGFSARGLIYLLIGGFTAVAALRTDQPTHGFTGAMETVARWPFGRFLILAAGL